MIKRRQFLKAVGASTAAALVPRHSLMAEIAGDEDVALHFASDSLELQLSSGTPQFLSLNVDGLGKGKRGANIIGAKRGESGYTASSSISGGVQRVEYRSTLAKKDSPPAWTFEFSGSRIVLTSEWSAEFEPAAMVFRFDLNQVHSTVLGLFRRNNLLATPALMHFPGQGSIRITANVPELGLTYVSDRPGSKARLSLPGANFVHKRIVYTLDVTASTLRSRESKRIRASMHFAATG